MEKIFTMKKINEEDTQKINEEEKTNKEEEKHFQTHMHNTPQLANSLQNTEREFIVSL